MKSFSFKKITVFLVAFMLTLGAFPGTFTAFAYDAGSTASPQKLSSSSFTTMVIKPDNALWGFGANNNYQLGNGKTDNIFTPVKIMDDVTAVSTGGAFWFEPGDAMYEKFQICFTAVIKTDKTLWTWGYNSSGQLGDGTFENRAVPAKVMDDVAAISAGGETLLVIKTDGSLWGCGIIRFGNTHQTPSFVKIMDDVSACSAGFTHMAAVKKDGTLWTWGDDNYGQLGTGGQTYLVTPTKVMDEVKSVTCENGYTFAIKSNNSLWAFGINGSNQLGNDGKSNTKHINEGTLSQSVPVKIMDNVSCVSAAFDHAAAVKTDGTLWTWGANSYGKIGDGTHDNHGLPVKIMDGVSYASCGYDHTVAVKTDGSVFTWGRNNVGQLGDDTKDERQSPVKVMDIGSEATPTPALTAKPTASTVLVNGENVAFDAYNINGNNYFKLRDLAYILDGTAKHFEVTWDGSNNAISLISGKAYTTVGGEMTGKGAGDKTPTATTSKILMDGKEVSFTAYNIDGNNYFKLRDIGKAFDFGVDWDSANNTIVIDTSKGYTAE